MAITQLGSLHRIIKSYSSQNNWQIGTFAYLLIDFVGKDGFEPPNS